MLPPVEVRLWDRPGYFSAKLYSSFLAFRDGVAAAVRVVPSDIIKLYYFDGNVLLAERRAITDDATLREFAIAHCAVWVFVITAPGPPSPEEEPSGAQPAATFALSSSSGRSSMHQKIFRAAILARDGLACVLCGEVEGAGGGKSRLEAAQ